MKRDKERKKERREKKKKINVEQTPTEFNDSDDGISSEFEDSCQHSK